MNRKICMGGVCGMGMAPLAAFLKEDGETVVGYDDKPNPEIAERLRKAGIELREGAKGCCPEEFDELVISTALFKQLKKLPIGRKKAMRRGEKWAELCSKRRLTAVIGSHGKSTVSALMAHAVNKTGDKCGWLVGAVPNKFPMHRYCPEGGIVISEIDESDATIENFSPEVTVALNADLDHTTTYADNGKLEAMFERLFARTKRLVLYPESDEMLARVAKKSKTPSRAVKTSGDFTAVNRIMALAALEETFGKIFASNVFDDFGGIMRRQELLADNAEVYALADYAHHPNEVRSFLDWFYNRHDGPKLVFFQPHRYSRTRRFATDFAEILDAHNGDTTTVVLLPVYAASEDFDPFGTSESIAARCLRDSVMLAAPKDFERILKAKIRACDGKKLALAVIGAGDFYFEAKRVLKELYEKPEDTGV